MGRGPGVRFHQGPLGFCTGRGGSPFVQGGAVQIQGGVTPKLYKFRGEVPPPSCTNSWGDPRESIFMTFGTCQKCYVRSVNNFFQTTFEVILVFWAFIWSSKYHHGLSFEILLINHVFIINLGVGYKKFHFHTFCTGRGGTICTG